MESNLKRKEENLSDLFTDFSNNSIQKGFSSVHEKKKEKRKKKKKRGKRRLVKISRANCHASRSTDTCITAHVESVVTSYTVDNGIGG